MENEVILGRGNTAKVILFEGNKVAKVFHEHIQSSYIDRELINSLNVMTTGIDVPKVYGEKIVQGKQAIIFERVEGIPLTKQMGELPLTVLKQIQLMAKLQVNIHNQSGIKLTCLKENLANKIERISDLSIEEKNEIIDYLVNLPDREDLCHGDFHPDNIILSDKGPVVIDWSDATVGNRMADLARTILILNYGGFPYKTSFFNFTLQSSFRKIMSFYLFRCYKKLFPFETKLYKKWILPVAAARLDENLPFMEKKKLLSIVRLHLKNYIDKKNTNCNITSTR